MKTELKKYPNMKLVTTVYGNDDPATATQVTQGLLQQYPNLKGIISPTTVGILAAAGVLDTAKSHRGKVAAHRAGHAELDEEVRVRRHGQGAPLRACGTRRTSATWPRTPRCTWPPAR